jgi:hypothetical protein
MGLRLEDFSPVAGAITGKGMFGDLIGKKSELAAEAKAEEEKKKAAAQGPAGTQAVAGQGMKKGGKVSSASSRADGIAQRGKTRGKMY